MIPRFAHRRPRSLADAFAAFDAAGGDCAWYAGGTELLAVMKMGFAQFGTLIDLKSVPELGGISADADGALRIGATVTHREIERSPHVLRHLPGLAALEREVANIRVRNTGTLGGNLAFAEPHSDPATFLLACDARVELAGPAGAREMAIDELIVGPLTTSREADELLVAIRVPAPAAGEGRAYAKLAFFERPAASVGVRVRVADGAIADATVAVGSLTDLPIVLPAAGAALAGLPAEPAALDAGLGAAIAVLGEIDAIPDHNGSADYKRHLAGILLGRAVTQAVEEARAHA